MDTLVQKKIMIVDDEPLLLRIYETLLAMAGYIEIATCSNGRQALEMAEREIPDLVLLDLTMPGMAGEELLRLLIKKFPDITVIIMSGDDEEEKIQYCLSLGATDFLSKTAEVDQILGSVKKALSKFSESP